MSFGFAIGDFVAVLGLFERIATELKNYRDAPARFQNLSVELDLLRSTLTHVLQAETGEDADKQILERIRAIVVHCHQPLQAFIEKLRSKDRSLGHYRTARLNDVGIRMKWSMVTQKDVEELRKVLLSEMVAINMLLSLQQLASLRRLSACTIESGQNSDATFDKTYAVAGIVQGIPDSIANLHLIVSQNAEEQTRRDLRMTQTVVHLSSQIEGLSIHGKRSVEIVRSGGAQIMRAVARLASIMRDLRMLLYLLSKYSKDMLEAISQNTRMLLDIVGHMKRMARAIESIPLHLSVDIIRLDDALGETWGLPFQACQTWESFKDILQRVVYANQRTGSDYIIRDQYKLILARTGRTIHRSDAWKSMIKAGTHIQQAMVVPELPYTKDACPYPSCRGTLSNQADRISRKCLLCERLSSAMPIDPPLLQVYGEIPHPSTSSTSQIGQISSPKPAQTTSVKAIGTIRPFPESLDSFRRIEVYERRAPLTSIKEAFGRLQENASDYQANLYLGWHALSTMRPNEAIQRLERAIHTEDSDWIPFYLLGRACIAVERLREAHAALQQCVHRHGRIPDVWISIGVLYHRSNQLRDSQNFISRSIRLNPNAWEPWYNLAVLYEKHNTRAAVLDALQRAIQLNPTLSNVRRRLQDLNAWVPGEPLTGMVECALRHISDPYPKLIEDYEDEWGSDDGRRDSLSLFGDDSDDTDSV